MLSRARRARSRVTFKTPRRLAQRFSATKHSARSSSSAATTTSKQHSGSNSQSSRHGNTSSSRCVASRTRISSCAFSSPYFLATRPPRSSTTPRQPSQNTLPPKVHLQRHGPSNTRRRPRSLIDATHAPSKAALRQQVRAPRSRPTQFHVCSRTQKPLRHPQVSLCERRPSRRRGDKRTSSAHRRSWKTSGATMWRRSLVWSSRGSSAGAWGEVVAVEQLGHGAAGRGQDHVADPGVAGSRRRADWADRRPPEPLSSSLEDEGRAVDARGQPVDARLRRPVARENAQPLRGGREDARPDQKASEVGPQRLRDLSAERKFSLEARADHGGAR